MFVNNNNTDPPPDVIVQKPPTVEEAAYLAPGEQAFAQTTLPAGTVTANGAANAYEYAGGGGAAGAPIIYAVPMENNGGIYAAVVNDRDNAIGERAGAAGSASYEYGSVGGGGAAEYVDPNEIGMRAGDEASKALGLGGARERADTYC